MRIFSKSLMGACSLLLAVSAQAAPSIQAATETANKSAACTKIAPFYWEIGNSNAAIGGGSVGTGYTQGHLYKPDFCAA